MAMTEREKKRRRLQALMEKNDLDSLTVAHMLNSSRERVGAWLRAEGQAGANPVPLWAIELLEFKIAGRSRQ